MQTYDILQCVKTSDGQKSSETVLHSQSIFLFQTKEATCKWMTLVHLGLLEMGQRNTSDSDNRPNPI